MPTHSRVPFCLSHQARGCVDHLCFLLISPSFVLQHQKRQADSRLFLAEDAGNSDIVPVQDALAQTEATTAATTAEDNQDTIIENPADPLDFGRHRRDNVSKKQMKIDHPKGDKRKLKKFYTRQNELIDQFLGADDEERLRVEEDIRVTPKIKFAVNASFVVNLCLFVIQMYAAISTGSLAVKPSNYPFPRRTMHS